MHRALAISSTPRKRPHRELPMAVIVANSTRLNTIPMPKIRELVSPHGEEH